MKNEKPLYVRGFSVIAEGTSLQPPLYVLIINSFFTPFPRPTACKVTTNSFHHNKKVVIFAADNQQKDKYYGKTY